VNVSKVGRATEVAIYLVRVFISGLLVNCITETIQVAEGRKCVSRGSRVGQPCRIECLFVFPALQPIVVVFSQPSRGL
jgi:hypothetical protein